MSYQEQKRVKSIPQKFRQPGNTDAELKKEEAKRKKKANAIKKTAQQSAKVKNMAHLASILDTQDIDQPMSETENHNHNENINDESMEVAVDIGNQNINNEPIEVTIEVGVGNQIINEPTTAVTIESETQDNSLSTIPINVSSVNYSDIVQEAVGGLDFLSDSQFSFEGDFIYMDDCLQFDTNNGNVYNTVDRPMPPSETFIENVRDSVSIITEEPTIPLPISIASHEPISPEPTVDKYPACMPSSSASAKNNDKGKEKRPNIFILS